MSDHKVIGYAPPNPQDPTIAAIVTAIGQAGIGVIRISGSEAFSVADSIFRSRSGRPVGNFDSHTVHHGSIVDPTSGEELDDVLLSIFKSPASYTGEDVVEISCHGGSVTLRAVLGAVFAAGAKPAGPGEFTKRAFLNGRIDLAQAEAVNDLIRARTDQARKLALRQLEGALSMEVAAVADRLIGLLARIEATIDFPEDVEEPETSRIASEITESIAALDQLIRTSDRGRIYREGISLAIIGRPNVGKSSLLNALLRETRAIVTAIPGTTRDVIEETIDIRGIPVVAADTAGLREAGDEVERIGVELTERTMAAAELVLVVLDASAGLTDEDSDILRRAGSQAIVVLNKIDLARAANIPDLAAVPVSAATGEGIELLEDRIAEAVLKGDISSEDGAFVTSARHKQSLLDARESLDHTLTAIASSLPIDLLPTDIAAARASLGEITGDTAAEDLLDRIFGEFCIGK